MIPARLASIVEGHGESESVPILIRRIAASIDPGYVPHVLPPIRITATKLRKKGELERGITLAARKLGGKGGILVLMDCDWDGGCPATDGPALLQRAKQVRGDLPIAVVLAKSEYESWFLAAAESLAGRRGLSSALKAPENPEAIRGAKEWLSGKMPRNMGYSATEHQAAFTEVFDMGAARRADSFDKCFREVETMLRELHA